jgi:hypothetical protein
MLGHSLLVAVLASAPLAAQEHAAHRHPPGAKIVVQGELVEPVCRFALRAADLVNCVQHQPDSTFVAILQRADSMLYVLVPDRSRPGLRARLRSLVGHDVKVDGTVFPAASGYLIVLDSIRPAAP